MRAIRTLNICWERRIRGAYAVSPYAIDDSGAVTLAIPRPLEPRSYDLTRIAADGAAQLLGAFTVETMLKLDAAQDSGDLAGMTSDDVYLFHGGSKLRFLPDRHISYVDVALSRTESRLAVAFSDIAGSSYAIAVGDTTGHVMWNLDVDHPISSIAVSPTGSHVAVGCEDGFLALLDAARREIWRFEQQESVRALAVSDGGRFVVYGCGDGTVGMIDVTGGQRWSSTLAGTVIAVALDAEGALCGALARPDTPNTTEIYCLLEDGSTGWDFEAERLLTRIAISAAGEYVATGGRDGTQSLYRVVRAEADAVASGAPDVEQLLAQVADHTDSGNVSAAYDAARAALEKAPSDLSAFDAFSIVRERLIADGLQQARRLRDENDLNGALDVVHELARRESDDVNVVTLAAELRRSHCESLLAEAAACRASDDIDNEEAHIAAAVRLQPQRRDVRERLSEIRSRRASRTLEEAERLLASKDAERAVAAFEQVVALAPTTANRAKLETAQTAMELAEGMAHYEAKRYREAIFQFRKVLARDPGNREAQRHLNFALRFEHDASTLDLSDRFSRLE